MTTYQQIRDADPNQYALLRAWDRRLHLHNSRTVPITEPWRGGLPNEELTRLALEDTRRPPQDREDILAAQALVERQRFEVQSQLPPEKPDLADAIVSIEFAYSEALTPLEEFTSWSEDQQRSHVALLVSELVQDDTPKEEVAEYLQQALLIALPTVMKQIIESDEQARRGAVAVPGPNDA